MTSVNLFENVRFYINKMVDECGQTPKTLVMDKETASIVSMVYAQSDMLHKQVFLFERIDLSGKKPLKYLNAIYFIRPIEENIQALIRELREPKYGNYYIYFSNYIEMNDIKNLAEADEYECVRVVQEFYADYLVVNPHLYSLNIPITYQKFYQWNDSLLQRTVQGLTSLLLSLRKKSAIIRYQNSSTMSKILAEKLNNSLRWRSDFLPSNKDEINPTIVLIIDRREDPVTPLLNQWTYQSMIHELIGIKNNNVNLSQVPEITKDLEEVIMNAEYDEFYAKNMYSNYGEIATNIKQLMQDYQEKHKSQSKVESVTDMQTFVKNYPEFKKLSGTVAKHVTIVSELARLVVLYHLLEVSETEQNLVCQNDHNNIVENIKSFIKNRAIRDEDIFRLLCLYGLRYEHNPKNEFEKLKQIAIQYRKFQHKYLHFLHILLDYGGQKARQDDLFHTQTTTIAMTKQLILGSREIENVYTQHVPLIKDLLEQLVRGKLKDTLYPSVISNDQIKQNNRLPINQQNQLPQQGQVIKPSEIIVYVIGGITYEESFHVHMMNEKGARIILGGSTIHNLSSFIDEVIAGSPVNFPSVSKEHH